MSLLGRDQILSTEDRETEDVEVPEWGGVVRVRSMSGRERDRYEQAVSSARADDEDAPIDNIRARLVAATAVDENGEEIFSESDVEALGEKSAAALDRVFSVARRLSGLGREAVEELEGNSEPGPSDSSTSP